MWGSILWLALAGSAFAQGWHSEKEAIWDKQAGRWLSLEELAAGSAPGEIWVFGETHATKDDTADPETYIHHANQARLIHALQALRAVSVGMEFLPYPAQDAVDSYVAGGLEESAFLKAVRWGGNPFSFYRPDVLAPRGTAGRTVALNIPPEIAAKVATRGKDSLSPEEQRFLPPDWHLGGDAYFERFQATMQGHVPPEKIAAYFWAQCLWDDTMAWKALARMEQAPEQNLVVIVGEFHVIYGGGLPAELARRGSARVRTLLQVPVEDWSEATLRSAIAPDARYGEAADFLWVRTGAVPNGS